MQGFVWNLQRCILVIRSVVAHWHQILHGAYWFWILFEWNHSPCHSLSRGTSRCRNIGYHGVIRGWFHSIIKIYVGIGLQTSGLLWVKNIAGLKHSLLLFQVIHRFILVRNIVPWVIFGYAWLLCVKTLDFLLLILAFFLTESRRIHLIWRRYNFGASDICLALVFQ